jgi:carboxyl-terminal processing protease
MPLVVMVDGGTASMGEIFASAVQEHGVATVIGSTTSGNVAAAQVFPLSDGSAIQITVLEIVSASGAPLNGVGVQPDEVLLQNYADAQADEDPVLDRAVALAHDEVAAQGAPDRGDALLAAA